MRERSRLFAQVEAVRRLERERADALEFAELAEAEGDGASLDDAQASARRPSPASPAAGRAP